MNRLEEKAQRMQGANRRARKRNRVTGLLGVLVAVISAAALVSGAMALTHADTLSAMLTRQSAMYAREAGAGEAAWVRADGQGAVDKDAQLRLRLAFRMPANSLQDAATIYMRVPDGLDLDGLTGRVYVGGPVDSPSEDGLVAVGDAQGKDGMLAVTFTDQVVLQNLGSPETAEAAAVPAQDVDGYVDVDLDWSHVKVADDGTAKLAFSTGVSLDVQKYVEPEAEPAEEPAAAEEPATADEPAAEPEQAEPASTDEPAAATEPATTGEPAATDDQPATTDEPATTDDQPADEPATTEEPAAEAGNTADEPIQNTVDEVLPAVVQTPGSSSYAEFLPKETSGVKRVSLAAPRREAAATSNDLTQYLTSGTSVMKLENGTWVPTTEVKEGDKIKVNLAYTFPAGVVTPNNRTFTYTVPDGVRPAEAQSGPITDPSGNEIGTYTIGTDGKMTVTFSESAAAGGGAVVGSTTWQGTATLSEGKDSGSVHFGGAAADVTIKKPEQQDTQYDIHTKKTGKLSEDHRTADYVVTVSTTKGTGDPVKFSDRIRTDNSQNVNPSYDQSSLVIYKVDANGNKTQVTGYTPNWNAGDANHPGLDVDNLPALNAGEKYEVHYKVNVNPGSGAEVGKIANSAGGITPKHNDWSWNQESWEKNIQKTGWYDKETGLISWRIKVNTNGTDVNGTRVYDALPDGLKLSGGYIVTCEDGAVIQNWAHNGESVVDYTFSNVSDEHKNKVFYIDFYTNAPEGDTTVNNTAQEWHGNNGYSTTGEIGVPVEHRTTDVTKTYKSDTVVSGRNHKLTWDVDVTLPDSPMTTFTFTDTIDNATGPNGEDMGAGTHYALLGELENYLRQHESGDEGHLKIKMNDYDYYIYGGYNHTAYENYNNGGAQTTNDMTIVVTYYDLDGNVVVPSDSTWNTKISRFDVKVTPATGFSKTGRHLTITDYPTHVDATYAEGGTTWNAKNAGDIDGHHSEVSHDIPNPKPLDKSAKAGNNTWVSDNATVKYDAETGTIEYRVLMETTKDGTITVVDTMPAGMTYVDGSVYARFYVNDNTEHDSNWRDANVDGVRFNGAQKPQVSVVNNPDGTSTVTFTIPDFHYTDTMPMVALHYKVSVKGDPYWQNGSNVKKTYTNNVTWDGHSDDNHTKVRRDVKTVDKSGVQLDKDGNAVQLDSNGNPTGTPVNKLRYYVDINPAARNLDKNSDVLTLVDQLSDVGKYSPALDLSSVHLYAFDANAEHNLGAEIDASRYSVQFDASAGKMTVKVPDSLACVLVYDYEITPNSVVDGNKVTNNCSLNGNWSSKTETQLKESSSSSTAYKAKIELDKVDGDNFRKLLPGAVFKLEKWENNSWATVSSNEAVGDDGKLTWDLAGVDKDKLSTDTLYRLIETTAPEGYKKDATPHYFIWMSSTLNGKTTDAGTSWAQSQGAGAKKTDANGNEIGGLQQSDVTFFKNSGGILYVPNKYTRVSVKKTWANSDGTPATAPSGASVKVGLYRYTQQPNADDSCNVNVVGIGAGTNQYDHKETRDTKVIKKNSTVKVLVDGWDLSFNVYIGGSVTDGLFDDSNNKGTQFGGTYSTVKGSYELTIPASYFSGDNQTVAVQLVGTNNAANVRITDYTAGSMELSDSSRTKIGDSVTLNAGNSWTHNWDNLEATDPNGNKYYYRVEEEDAGSYTVSYTNNDGIQTGIITVTNSTQGYELPKTGGAGIWSFVLVGGVLAAVAAVARWRAARPASRYGHRRR